MADRILVFGAGWIGTSLAERVAGATLVPVDIADEGAVARVLDAAEATHVVNAAGKTGHPNIDALEGQAAVTYRSNVEGPLVLARLCAGRQIHLTHLGSGCIYQGDNGGAGFTENDAPNFGGSLYARSKAIAEAALRDFDVLQLRLRMPMASQPHPRNLITKLANYARVISEPNSVTVLDDAWPVVERLIRSREVGVLNLVNDGVERHDELLAMYADVVDPAHRFEVVDTAALQASLAAPRSNCVLSTARLHERGCALPPIAESLPRILSAYATHRNAARTSNSS